MVTPVLFASGCLAPFWVCPKVEYVPTAKVDVPADMVHVFRVDTRQSTPYFPGPLGDTHQLTPIVIKGNGNTPAQFQLSCTRGFLAFFVALNYVTWRQETLAVRIYRPGYETVERRSWELGPEVVWKPAEALDAQAKAIDDLVVGSLEAGGISRGHRQALLFAASEYERLASQFSNREAQAESNPQSLLEKANKLRERADEKYAPHWISRLIE